MSAILSLESDEWHSRIVSRNQTVILPVSQLLFKSLHLEWRLALSVLSIFSKNATH